MDDDKLNLGTPKNTSSQSVRGTEVSWCAEALARWTAGRPPKTCFFYWVDIHPSKFDMDIHDRCIFKEWPFSNHHSLSNVYVFWGVHLFFILTLYVSKNLLCFIWFISSVTRCIFPHVYIHHIIDMYVHPLMFPIASWLPWICLGQHLSFKYRMSGCVQRKGSQLQLPVKHVECKFDRINGKIQVHK